MTIGQLTLVTQSVTIEGTMIFTFYHTTRSLVTVTVTVTLGCPTSTAQSIYLDD
jgi:hypothetical protein